MFDVGGRIILRDDFSQALDLLIGKSKQGEQALKEVGDAADPAMKAAKTRVAELTREIEQLRAKSKGQPISIIDLQKFSQAKGELQSIQGDMAALAGETEKTGGWMEKLGQYTLITGAAFGAMRIGQTVFDLAKLGAQAQTVQQVFYNLSSSAGVNGQKLIAEMQTAARGTVDSVTQMTTANRALLAGGADLANQVPRLFEIARAASLATGQDINYVFETLVRGIAKASPLLIDNADIYIKIGAAVDEWAAKQGKVADELTMTERRVAIMNAVIDQGGAFMERMGISAETSADKMQSLGAASTDLKIALGELLSEQGVADMVSVLAKSLERGAKDVKLGKQLDEVRDKLKGLDDGGAALRAFDAEYQKLLSRKGKPMLFASADEIAAWKDQGTAAIDSLLERYQKLSLTSSDQVAFTMAAGVAKSNQAAAEGSTVWQAYSAALSQAVSTSMSASGIATQLGQISGAVKALASDLPKVPNIGETLFSGNVADLRTYAEQIKQLGDADLVKAADQLLLFTNRLDAQQQALLANVTASGQSKASLDALAVAVFGAGAGADDLVKNFAKLPPAVQSVIDPVRLLEQAVADLQAQAAAPITIDVRVAGLEQTLNSIDTMSLRLAGVLDPDKIKAFREKARTDALQHWTTMGQVDEFGMKLEQATLTQGYQKIVDNTLDAYKKIENGVKQAGTNIAASASELRSKIQSALKSGLEVTQEDMDLTNLGKYKPKALESARQLAAIAERGFSELQAHPDWASLLKIPPEVLAGSETELKAWASQTQADVQDLARPDLINWDAFVANFKAGLDKEAAQNLTIDIAVDKLNAAGLLSGSPDERRKKVAEALGLAEPSMTIDTLFQVAGDAGVARTNLIDQFLGGDKALKIPVEMIYQKPEGAQSQIEGTGSPVQGAGPAVGGMNATQIARLVDVDAASEPLKATGAKGIGYFVEGAIQQLKDTQIALSVASSWMSDFTANQTAFESLGTGTGNVVFGAFQKAMTDNMGNVRKKMAELILPEVVSMLNRSGNGGSKP